MESEILKQLIVGILMGVLLILPAWKIHKKAGLTPWLSLLLFIPLIGLTLVYVILAFKTWPNTKDKGIES